jgi:hypothetical protein
MKFYLMQSKDSDDADLFRLRRFCRSESLLEYGRSPALLEPPAGLIGIETSICSPVKRRAAACGGHH